MDIEFVRLADRLVGTIGCQILWGIERLRRLLPCDGNNVCAQEFKPEYVKKLVLQILKAKKP